MGAARIFWTVTQKSNEPLITVVSLKTGKEPFNFLEPELSEEYRLAVRRKVTGEETSTYFNVEM